VARRSKKGKVEKDTKRENIENGISRFKAMKEKIDKAERLKNVFLLNSQMYWLHRDVFKT